MTATVRPGPRFFPRLRVAVCPACRWVGLDRDVSAEPLCRRDAWIHNRDVHGEPHR